MIVNWFQLSPENREEGKNPESILQNDMFTISGDQLTNLTISSLTEELDDVIIFCGFDTLIANFTLRIYRQLLSQ